MRVDKKCLSKNLFSWTRLILKEQAQNFIFQDFHILWQEKCNILLCQNKVPGNLKKRFFIFNCKPKIRRFFCICRNGCLFLWFPASEAEGDWNIIWVLNKAGDSRDSSKRIFIARRTTGARAASNSRWTDARVLAPSRMVLVRESVVSERVRRKSCAFATEKFSWRWKFILSLSHRTC